MNKLLPLIWAAGLAVLLSPPALAQTYPSPTFSALTVNSNATIAGTLTVGGHLITPSTAANCPSIESFGGGVGVDNSPVLTSVLSTAGATPLCVSFGAGSYPFNSTVSNTLSGTIKSITLLGVGQDVTNLQASAGLLNLTFTAPASPSIHLRDFSIVTAAHATSTAISITSAAAQAAEPPQSDLDRITIRGLAYGSFTQCFSTGLFLHGISNVNVNGMTSYGCLTGSPASGGTGIGIQYEGNSATSQYAVVLNISHSWIQGYSVGLLYGSFVQGVTVSDGTNINFNGTGIETSAGALGVLGQLSIVNSQFSNYTNNIVTGTAIAGLNISNNMFLIFASTSGIVCSPCAGGQITGNIFNGFSTTGTIAILVATSNSGPMSITGNTFGGNGLAIEIGAGVSHVGIQSNAYQGNTTNVSNFGSISAGSCVGIAGTCAAGASF